MSEPLSRAERTGFRETSTHEDVLAFLKALQARSKLLAVETFGTSVEGRPLPLAIVADPPLASPEEARRRGLPIAFVMANIHAGEVEGKEAAQHLLRRVLLGDLAPLAKRLVLLVAPNYNADGNERFGRQEANRPGQNGPPIVGVRPNAMGLDLNRDYVKLESPEARALVLHVFGRWDPHLTIDCHATDGSYHGYALTWSPPLTPNGRPEPKAYVRERLLPAVQKALWAKGVRTFHYGNFDDPKAPEKGWRTFDHRPRFGNSYLGLRNRLCVLSEAYVYDDFRRRVESTEAFLVALLEHVAGDGAAAMAACAAADAGIRTGQEIAVRADLAPPERMEVLARETPLGPDRAVTCDVFHAFRATRTVPRPKQWFLEPSLGVLADLCCLHGIRVESAPPLVRMDVESYRLMNVHRDEDPFQGHRTVLLETQRQRRPISAPTGGFLVDAVQPLGDVAASILEPDSDDGAAVWNHLDGPLASLRPGAPDAWLPIHRVV